MPGLLDMRPRRRLMPPYLLQDEDYGADESQRPMGGLLNAPIPADEETDAPDVPPMLPQGILGAGVPEQSYRGPRNPAAIKLDALRERALELTGEHKVSLLRNILSRIAGGLVGAVGGGRAGVATRQEITGEAGRRRELGDIGKQGSILQGILKEEEGRQVAEVARRKSESEISENIEQAGLYRAQATAKPENKVSHHYTNADQNDVTVYVDGTEKVGGKVYQKPERGDTSISTYEDFRAGFPNTSQGRAQAAREWQKLQREGKDGEKPISQSQRAAAERWKQSQLRSLRADAARRQDAVTKGVEGAEAMSEEEFRNRWQDIQDSYEEQLASGQHFDVPGAMARENLPRRGGLLNAPQAGRPAPKGKLSLEQASEYLRRAGGDKEKARALARSEGWEF